MMSTPPLVSRTAWSSLLMLVLVAGCRQPAQQTPPASAQPASSAASTPQPPASELAANVRYVDLSHDLSAESVFWPTAETFKLKSVADGMTPGGYYYASNDYSASEHGGTHLDAPVHFAQGRWTTEQVPLDRLIGAAVVVDVSAQSAANADYRVSVADLTAWEQSHGALAPDTIVLLKTGYSTRWPDAQTYLGTPERGAAAVAKLHFPGLHQDAATWLAEERKVKAVGIDTASIDYGQSTGFDAHRVLCGRNIPVFENLTSLDQLPPRGATVYALPIKIKGGSGGPLRAIAVIPGKS
jgi:kynurenine formamidase